MRAFNDGNLLCAEKQDDDKGLNIFGLKPGTTLCVETANSMYQIKLLGREKIEIMGGMRPNGEYRFPMPTPACLVGSFEPYSVFLRRGWIGKNLCLTIEFENQHTIRTSAVKNVSIEGEGWTYSFDWDK